MNAKQRRVLLLAVVLFSLSELFPPWLYEDGWDSAARSAGYHFIYGPEPEIKPYGEMKKIFSIPDDEPQHGFTVRKDLGRLYGQRLTLLFFTIGLLLILNDRRSFPGTLVGGVSLCFGIGFLGVYVLYISWH